MQPRSTLPLQSSGIRSLPILLRTIEAKLSKERSALRPAQDTSKGSRGEMIDWDIDGHSLTHKTLCTRFLLGLVRAVCVSTQQNAKHIGIQSKAIRIEHIADFFNLPGFTFLRKGPCQRRVSDFAWSDVVILHFLKDGESTLSVANLCTGIDNRSVRPYV